MVEWFLERDEDDEELLLFQELKEPLVPLCDLKIQHASLKEEVNKAIKRVVESSCFILGPEVREFEEEIALYAGVPFAVGVASGTDALLLSLMAMGIGPGHGVITSSYSFFATAGSIWRAGARPIFLDIDPKTYNLDPQGLETFLEAQCTYEPGQKRLIHQPTGLEIKAIIPVHLFGQCAEMGPILRLAREFDLKVIEDAAQALGSKYKGKKAGTMADCGCYSFFPSKNLGAFGDAGMVVTRDEGLAEKIKILRVHGSQPKYYHSLIGFNSRLDTLQAAVLKVKLKYLDKWCQERLKRAQYYNKAFKGIDGLQTPFESPSGLHTYNLYVIRTKRRDALVKHLEDWGIACGLYYPLPLHLQPCFEALGYKEGSLPHSEAAAKESLAIPLYPELEEDKQEFVVETIRGFFK